MRKHNGACYCGEIRYDLKSEILNVVNCHCDFCRSHSGAAFSTYAALPYRSLKITKGREKLGCYETDEGKKETFLQPLWNTDIQCEQEVSRSMHGVLWHAGQPAGHYANGQYLV